MIIKEISYIKSLLKGVAYNTDCIYWEVTDSGLKLVHSTIEPEYWGQKMGQILLWKNIEGICNTYRKLKFISVEYQTLTPAEFFLEIL